MTVFVLLAAATTAAALPDVTVIGSRVATAQEDLAANVTVLRRETFDSERPQELADLLRHVAGVHVDTVGARGGTGSIYIRGADPNYTLVLVNGVRVNDPTNSRGGSYDLSALDIADVERVEIARGPYSAIYGGDALAGVINIITRPEATSVSKVSVDASAGAYDTSNLALRWVLPTENARWHFGVSDVNEGDRVRGNHFDVRRASGGVDVNLSAATDVSLSARYAESKRRAFPDDSGGYEYAALRDAEARDAQESVLGVGLTHHLGQAAFELAVGYFERADSTVSPGVAPGIRDPFGVPPSLVDTDLTRYTATLTATQPLTSAVSLAYGVDWQRETGSSAGELDFGGGFIIPTAFELTRSSWAPFAEMRVDSSIGLSAQAGARLDMPDDESTVTSPRVRIAYELTDGVSIATSWGKAFKLPSLYALGHPLVGNPELSPERSESHEIELSQTLRADTARWSVAWFDSSFRNAIDFESGPPPMLVNRNRVRSRGAELTGWLKAGSQWTLDASLTHARSRVTATGNALRNRPDWNASIGGHWAPTQSLKLSAAAVYTGSSFDSSIATGDVRLPDYLRIDATAVWTFSKRVEAFVAIDNLTGQRYSQFVGFETRGIVPQAGIRLTM